MSLGFTKALALPKGWVTYSTAVKLQSTLFIWTYSVSGAGALAPHKFCKLQMLLLHSNLITDTKKPLKYTLMRHLEDLVVVLILLLQYFSPPHLTQVTTEGQEWYSRYIGRYSSNNEGVDGTTGAHHSHSSLR